MRTFIAIVFVFCVFAAPTNAAAQAAALDLASRCTITTLESRSNRVQIYCATDGGNVSFAVPTTSTGTAARFTEIALSALINNKKLLIVYRQNDLTGPNFGCVAPACRPARAIQITP